MRSNLIIEGNAVYEIDEECMKRKRTETKRPAPKDKRTDQLKEKGAR